MLASEASWLFILLGLVVMTPISLIASALITVVLNSFFRSTWHYGFIRNSIVGLIVAFFTLLIIIFTAIDPSWLNGQPQDWAATLWENAGKIALVISGITVGVFHILAKHRDRKSFVSKD